jgi:hypothetical protein
VGRTRSHCTGVSNEPGKTGRYRKDSLYRGLDDGTEFDSSKGKDPLEVTLGSGQVIPGFEQAIQGMALRAQGRDGFFYVLQYVSCQF